MDPIIKYIADFMETLPPLLQLLTGAFITLGIVKVVLLVANYIQARGEEKK